MGMSAIITLVVLVKAKLKIFQGLAILFITETTILV